MQKSIFMHYCSVKQDFKNHYHFKFSEVGRIQCVDYRTVSEKYNL